MRKQCSLFARFCRVAKRAKMVNIWETRLRSFVSFLGGGGDNKHILALGTGGMLSGVGRQSSVFRGFAPANVYPTNLF